MNTDALQLFYPDFVPNQVLTNTQLNQLRAYLDEQTRLSRVRLVGRGIVCGLTWRVDVAGGTARTITLREGFGLTSDGYLIDVDAGDNDATPPLDEVVFSGVYDYTDPDADEDGTPAYAPWRTLDDPPQQIALLGLVPDAVVGTEDEPEGTRTLRQADLNGRVLVLYLEQAPESLRSCLVTNCDNRGLNVRLHARLLLVEQTHLDAWDPCGTPLTTSLQMPRLHTEVDLTTVSTADDLNAAFGTIAQAMRVPLADALDDVFSTYAAFLDLDADATDTARSRLEAVLDSGLDAASFRQYHYDFVRDLADAHNDFVAAACALIRPCCRSDDFPRHLMLGADGADGFRHTFVASSARNVMHDDLAYARQLYDRFLALILEFDGDQFAAPIEVRITPSQTVRQPLGERAVPYYYGPLNGLRDLWWPRRCCTVAPVYSYHEASTALDHNATAYSFWRIEGHLGDVCTDVEDAIDELRATHNLAFDVHCLYLRRSQAADEQEATEELLETERKLDEGYANLRTLIREGATIDDEEIQERLAEFVAVRQEIYENRYPSWLEIRTAGQFMCDIDALRADYLAGRSDVLGRYSALLDQVDTFDALIDQISNIAVEGVSMLVNQFRLDVVLLRDDLREMMHFLLPLDVIQFNHPVFAHVHRRLIDGLARIRLALTYLYLYSAHRLFDPSGVNPAVLEGTRAQLASPEVQELVSSVYGLVRDGEPAQLGTVYHTLEHVRARDLSAFTRFAARYRGIEHRAGVPQGGTFLLVCDEDGEDGEDGMVTVADFALPGRLPCCCPMDLTDLCLPPIARTDYYFVRLSKEESSLERQFNLVRNDYSRNQHDEAFDEEATSSLVLTGVSESELDASVDIEGPHTITYQLEAPEPFTFDRFTYDLGEEDECEGVTTGQVVLLFVPPLPPYEAVESETGIIRGTIFDCNAEAPLAGANVILESTETGAITDANGGYVLQHVPAGTHSVRISAAGYRDEQIDVTLAAEQTLTLDACLEKGTNLRVEVIDSRTEVRLTTAVVDVEGPVTDIRDIPDADGRYSFSVPPGQYEIRAAAPLYNDGGLDTFEVKEGVLNDAVVPLRRLDSVNPNDRIVTHLVEAEDITRDEAVARVSETIGDRMEARVEAVTTMGRRDEQLAASRSYERVETFLRETAGAARDADALDGAYDTVLRSLRAAIGSAGDERKADFVQLLEVATEAYLDRTVLRTPDELPDEDVTRLESTRDALKSAGVDMAEFGARWVGGRLREDLGVESAAQVNDLLGV